MPLLPQGATSVNDKLRAIGQLAYFRLGLTQHLGQLISLSGITSLLKAILIITAKGGGSYH
jgi:hypothetical protein